jgi:hypothetical protein
VPDLAGASGSVPEMELRLVCAPVTEEQLTKLVALQLEVFILARKLDARTHLRDGLGFLALVRNGELVDGGVGIQRWE